MASAIRGRLNDFIRNARDEGHGRAAKNFLQSLLMLAGAMAAALYANSAARDGRVLAAGIGALIAMSVALWVGVRFVPSLAAGVDWGWLPFLTKYRLTREGWIFIAVSLVVTSAAINTNNNLLYMVLAAMLAVMVLSGVLSAMNFRYLEASARLPDHGFAGDPFSMAISIVNRKRLLPTFSISICPAHDSAFRYEPYYVAMVRSDLPGSRAVTATLPARGRFDFGNVRIQSRYPFGFLLKGREIKVKGGMVAFPAILEPEGAEAALRDILGSSERLERGGGMDLYMIREYQSSDSARHVDWKASAKTAQLKTREFAAEESRRVTIAFDRYGRAGQSEAFERLVSESASMAVHLVRGGAEVTLAADDWVSSAARTEAEVEAILHYLAVVGMDPAAGPPEVDQNGEAIRFSLRAGRTGQAG